MSTCGRCGLDCDGGAGRGHASRFGVTHKSHHLMGDKDKDKG